LLIDPWVEDAPCKGVDTDVFFPERGKAHVSEKIIKPLCRECPVQQKCLNYALKHDITEGYYGGFSGKQRRAIKSASRRGKVLVN
jgi:WhiB family redox-sensing transcriptional regulator